jgi:hypothetical protein
MSAALLHRKLQSPQPAYHLPMIPARFEANTRQRVFPMEDQNNHLLMYEAGRLISTSWTDL